MGHPNPQPIFSFDLLWTQEHPADGTWYWQWEVRWYRKALPKAWSLAQLYHQSNPPGSTTSAASSTPPSPKKVRTGNRWSSFATLFVAWKSLRRRRGRATRSRWATRSSRRAWTWWRRPRLSSRLAAVCSISSPTHPSQRLIRILQRRGASSEFFILFQYKMRLKSSFLWTVALELCSSLGSWFKHTKNINLLFCINQKSCYPIINTALNSVQIVYWFGELSDYLRFIIVNIINKQIHLVREILDNLEIHLICFSATRYQIQVECKISA